MNESISIRSVAQMHSRELSRISDAMRTPLTSIVGFAEAILSDPAMEAERVSEFTRIIKSEGERLSRFVNEILYVSFSDPDGEDREPAKIDVTSLIDTVIQVVSSRLEESTAKFHNENQLTPFKVEADKQFLLAVLSNMLGNMARFGQDDTPIFVCANLIGAKLHLTVTGHRKNELDRQHHETLGLARTAYLVSLHKGSFKTTRLENGETCLEAILPVSPVREPVH